MHAARKAAWNSAVSSSYGSGGLRSAPPPNQALLVVRKRVFMCTAGTCGLAMCATRLMPVAVKPGVSSLAPWIVCAKPGANSPETVETLTPTFSNTLPFITPRTPPPPSLASVVSRFHGT